MYSYTLELTTSWPHFSSGIAERNASTRKITSREKGETRRGERKMRDPDFSLSPPRIAFLAWGAFHARSLFARCTIPEEKWGLLVVQH